MKCSVEDCPNPSFARTWCRKHYMRWWSHGDVNVVKNVVPPTGAVFGFFEYAISYGGDDCLIWPYSDNGVGYGIMTVDGESVLVSRMICERTRGQAPSAEHQAAHSCDNGHLGCVTKNHLRWATPRENHADTVTHGTQSRGEAHPGAKLTEQQVMEIFFRSDTQGKIASEFGVSQTLVGKIKRRERWGWLTSMEATA